MPVERQNHRVLRRTTRLLSDPSPAEALLPQRPTAAQAAAPEPSEAATESGPLHGAAAQALIAALAETCLLYTSPSPRDATLSRMPSSA